MDFIAIDFETATSQRSSPCEIGLTFVAGDQIEKTISWLVKPPNNDFDYFNTMMHGIGPEDVRKKPEFDEVWNEVKPHIEGKFLIAHNAGFDMSVLRRSLEYYSIPFPELQYSCSYIFSKKVWTGLPAYDLKSLCKLNGIELQHHRAGPDSKATAELSLKAFQVADVSSVDDFPIKLRTTIGRVFTGGYRPSETKHTHSSKTVPVIFGNPSKKNPQSIFYGKTVVFTGTLSSMIRSEAQQLVADIGGVVGGGITRETDFLIVGQQDYRVVGDDGMSSKQEKAIKLLEKGSSIEILSEDDFLRNL